MNVVRGDTKSSPIQPTNVCSISEAIILELRILSIGVPCAMKTIMTDI